MPLILKPSSLPKSPSECVTEIICDSRRTVGYEMFGHILAPKVRYKPIWRKFLAKKLLFKAQSNRVGESLYGKGENFEHISIFWSNIESLVKNRNFGQKFKFGQKSKFWSKIKILIKNRLGKNLTLVQNWNSGCKLFFPVNLNFDSTFKIVIKNWNVRQKSKILGKYRDLCHKFSSNGCIPDKLAGQCPVYTHLAKIFGKKVTS